MSCEENSKTFWQRWWSHLCTDLKAQLNVASLIGGALSGLDLVASRVFGATVVQEYWLGVEQRASVAWGTEAQWAVSDGKPSEGAGIVASAAAQSWASQTHEDAKMLAERAQTAAETNLNAADSALSQAQTTATQTSAQVTLKQAALDDAAEAVLTKRVAAQEAEALASEALASASTPAELEAAHALELAAQSAWGDVTLAEQAVTTLTGELATATTAAGEAAEALTLANTARATAWGLFADAAGAVVDLTAIMASVTVAAEAFILGALVGALAQSFLEAWEDDTNADHNPCRDPDDPRNPTPKPGTPPRPVDPLVLDLSGNGISLTSLPHSNAFFDYRGDGIRSNTGWVSAEEGLLVLAPAVGEPVAASNLIGALSGNGFSDLIALDLNNDGVLDASDAGYADLRVWIDADGNGESSDAELFTLNDLGISAIGLNSTVVGKNVDGNIITATATFTINGRSSTIAEVNFAVSSQNVILPSDDGVTLTEDALKLPNLTGFGFMADLAVAVSLDTDLEAMVYDLVFDSGTMTGAQFDEAFQAMVLEWAGATDINPTSQGAFVDARHLAVVYAYFGIDPDVQTEYQVQPNWHNGPTVWEPTYNQIISGLKARFASQIAHSLMNYGTDTETAFANPYASFGLLGYSPDANEFEGNIADVLQNQSFFVPTDSTAAAAYWDRVAPIMKALAVDMASGSLGQSGAEQLVALVAVNDLPDSVLAQIAAAAGMSFRAAGAANTDLPELYNKVAVVSAGDSHFWSGGNDILIVGKDVTSFQAGWFDQFTAYWGSTHDVRLILKDIENPSDVNLSLDLETGTLRVTYPDGSTLDLISFYNSRGGTQVVSVTFGDGTSVTGKEFLDDAFASFATSGDDTIVGFSSGGKITGGAGNDILSAPLNTYPQTTFDGGTGDDVFDLQRGDGKFIYNLGDGDDVVVGMNQYLPSSGGISFGPGITRSDITIAALGDQADTVNGRYADNPGANANSLIVSIAGGGSLTFVTGPDAITDITFADGSVMTAQEVAEAYVASEIALGLSSLMMPGVLGEITGVATASVLVGSKRAERNVFHSGPSDETFIGQDTYDEYYIGQSPHSYTILNGTPYLYQSMPAEWYSTLYLGTGITPDDLVLSGTEVINGIVNRRNIKISIPGENETIELVGQNVPSGYWIPYNGEAKYHKVAVGSIQFADGTIWSQADIRARAYRDEIVTAISAFAPGVEVKTGTIARPSTTFDDYAQNDILSSSSGATVLAGGWGSNTYNIAAGDGNTIIANDIDPAWEDHYSGPGQDHNQVNFGPGIESDDVTVSQSADGRDLILTVGSTGQTVTLHDQLIAYVDSMLSGIVSTVHFDDGTSWTVSDLFEMSVATAISSGASIIYGASNLGGLTITAGSGDVTLDSNGASATLIAGDGNDILIGDSSQTTFQIGASEHQYVVRVKEWGEEDYNPQYQDEDVVLTGISADDVTVSTDTGGTNVILSIVGSTETITLEGAAVIRTPHLNESGWFYDGPAIPKFTVHFDDGTEWTQDDLFTKALFTGRPGLTTLQGSGLGNTFDPNGYAHQVIDTGTLADTVVYKRGYGAVSLDLTVQAPPDDPESPLSNGIIAFGAGITIADLEMRADASGALIIDLGDGDEITIENGMNIIHPLHGYHGIKTLQFADGTSLYLPNSMNLVDRNALFNATIYGTAQAEQIDCLAGKIVGGGGADEIYYASNGSVTINEVEASGTPTSKLHLQWVTPDQVSVSVTQNGDVILTIGWADIIKLTGQLSTSTSSKGVSEIIFDNGTIWDNTTLASLATPVVDKNMIGDATHTVLTGDGSGGFIFDPNGFATEVHDAGHGGDQILYNAGYGDLLIDETAYWYNPADPDDPDWSASSNWLTFGEGIDFSDLSFAADENFDLIITVDGGDQITIKNGLFMTSPSIGGECGIAGFEFADGSWYNFWDDDIFYAVDATALDGIALQGTSAAEALSPNGFVHTVIGGGGEDQIQFNPGQGALVVDESDASGAAQSTLNVGFEVPVGVSATSNVNGDVMIDFGNGDVVTLLGQLATPGTQAHGVGSISFYNAVWTNTEIEALISTGMASPAPVVDEVTIISGSVTEAGGDSDPNGIDETSLVQNFTDDASQWWNGYATAVTATGDVAGIPDQGQLLWWLHTAGSTAPSGGNPGEAQWTFSAPRWFFDYLGDGQSVTLTYDTVLIDSAGSRSASQPFVITVNGANDAPKINGTPESWIDSWVDWSIDVSTLFSLAGISDPEGDTVTLSSVQDATHGSVALVGNTISYTAQGAYNGPASFSYTVTDGSNTRTGQWNVYALLHHVDGTWLDDSIAGGSKSAQINGYYGDDTIAAGSAGDIIIGGEGNDDLAGGAGADVFQFYAGFGLDTIHDFATSGAQADVLQFDQSLFEDWAHLLGATTQVGSDLVITLDADDKITLKNVAIANFTQSNAAFV